MSRDPCQEQLTGYKSALKNGTIMTSGSGNPVDTKTASLTVGPKGPLLLQDFTLVDELAHFDRERIPERVVHAKGAGAFGYFEVTHDVTKYTKLSVFSKIGKRTPVAVRFSTVGGESGSADTVRDPRGFAVKFYAEDGNWDVVGNNTPIFFIRDPILFPSFIHTQKRNPVTHLKDMDMFWDFLSLRPESIHQVMFLFSDRGIPDGYRHMNGYGSHTFKLVNDKDETFFCKFHYKTDQGIKNLPVEKAGELSGSDPDYSIRDLHNAIARKQFPSWTWHIQVMTQEQAQKCKFNPFDLTKVWPHGEYPLIQVGKMVLDRNPTNYFTEVEQIAFSPAHLIPGVEPSPDKMLQGRLFSYSDTHRHRLGANYLQLPVNCPYRTTISNSQRDGPACYGNNQAGTPNYFPNSFSGPECTSRGATTKCTYSGEMARYESADEDNFTQATQFYKKTLTLEERKRLAENIIGALKEATDFIQERAVNNFSKVDAVLGTMLSEGLKKYSRSKPHL